MMLVLVEAQVVLSKELVDGVRGLGGRWVILRNPLHVGFPVDGPAGADEDKLSHACLAAVLQDVEQAEPVYPRIQGRITR